MDNKTRYIKKELLGKGAYGKVYRGIDTQDNKEVALKKMKLKSVDEGIPVTSLREIALLKSLDHPNIMKLYNVIHGSGKLTLVVEYVKYDLEKLMSINDYKLAPELIKSFLYQMLAGIKHCHKNKVIHRDLKPQNLLISEENVLKLADFGLARDYMIPVKNYTSDVVTLYYRPPDVLLGSKDYFETIDIWSIGCIFAEMIIGEPLMKGNNEKDQLTQIFKIFGTPNDSDWPQLRNLPDWKKEAFEVYPAMDMKEVFPGIEEDAIDILTRMLTYDPEKRITAKEALEHRYFDDLDENVKKSTQ